MSQYLGWKQESNYKPYGLFNSVAVNLFGFYPGEYQEQLSNQ